MDKMKIISFSITLVISSFALAAAHASATGAPTASQAPAARRFVHPGLLHGQADFDRMATKVKDGQHPWIDSWNILIANNNSSLDRKSSEVAVIYRGNDHVHAQNYSRLMYDAAAAYQTALRWKISGDDRYAAKSVSLLNAWSSTLTEIGGSTDACLALGLYGYELANAAEIMRTYSGWSPDDFARFQRFMLTVFYPGNHRFLVAHNGTRSSHYWANWDLCNMDAILAIGVLCDRPDIYDEAIAYFKAGIGNGNIDHTVYYIHPGNLGQWQEAGRDQGHTTLGASLVGAFCEMAWHQGDDLYGYEKNRVLAGVEYIAKYNLGHDVPYLPYSNDDTVQGVVSDNGRGGTRPGWDLLYNHYVNIKGIAAPYTAEFAAKARPDGGGGNYGPNSGGFDQLGFTTLTATLDPIPEGAPPSGLTAQARGSAAVLSWWGSANAASYVVRRASAAGGPYKTIATVTDTTYRDATVSADAAYYYKVVALVSSNKQLVSNMATVSMAPKLIAEYPFMAGSATDDTRQQRPVSLVNGASIAAGGALALNGADQYAQLPDGIADGLTDCTVACWVKLAKVDKFARVFDLGDDAISYVFFAPCGGDGNPQFTITCAGGSGEQTVRSATPFPIGVWTHVAVTLVDGVATLYINGAVAGSKSGVPYTPADFGHSHRNYLGRSQYTDSSQSKYNDPYLNGSIADFRLYSGGLTREGIAELAKRMPNVQAR
jgi:hypothetical protein